MGRDIKCPTKLLSMELEHYTDSELLDCVHELFHPLRCLYIWIWRRFTMNTYMPAVVKETVPYQLTTCRCHHTALFCCLLTGQQGKFFRAWVMPSGGRKPLEASTQPSTMSSRLRISPNCWLDSLVLVVILSMRRRLDNTIAIRLAIVRDVWYNIRAITLHWSVLSLFVSLEKDRLCMKLCLLATCGICTQSVFTGFWLLFWFLKHVAEVSLRNCDAFVIIFIILLYSQ